jgi:hypothetical protein
MWDNPTSVPLVHLCWRLGNEDPLTFPCDRFAWFGGGKSRRSPQPAAFAAEIQKIDVGLEHTEV